MKTSQEFFDRIGSDREFAETVAKALQAKREAGAGNFYETYIPVAEENGYSLTREDLDDPLRASAGELSEEELGKIAGGTSCYGFTVVTIVTVVSMTVTGSILATLSDK